MNKILIPPLKYQKTIYSPTKNVETGLYPPKKDVSYKSSSNSPSIQVLRQQIRGVRGGSGFALIMLTQGGVQNQEKLADVILERSLRLQFAKKQICIEFMCAWVTHAHMRVGEPRAQNIDVCVCSLCAWVSHAHVYSIQRCSRDIL